MDVKSASSPISARQVRLGDGQVFNKHSQIELPTKNKELETMNHQANEMSAPGRLESCIAICLICPLIRTLDNWDHTIQTGNDTEYALVALALCVGVAYSFARFVFKSTLVGFVTNSEIRFPRPESFLFDAMQFGPIAH
jgi:hypothetical protein